MALLSPSGTWQAEQSLLPSLTTAIHESTRASRLWRNGHGAGRQRFAGGVCPSFVSSPCRRLRRARGVMVVVGLYGVVAYSVGQRTREIGVRMALGAGRSSVYRLILKEAGRLITAGMTIGLACAVAAATVMRGLLFGVSSWDVPTLCFGRRRPWPLGARSPATFPPAAPHRSTLSTRCVPSSGWQIPGSRITPEIANHTVDVSIDVTAGHRALGIGYGDNEVTNGQ